MGLPEPSLHIAG